MIENTTLYTRVSEAFAALGQEGDLLRGEFTRLRQEVASEGDYIVTIFPEYTPHNEPLHLAHLFALADALLVPVYGQLAPMEIVLLAFGLYCHDWGMAISTGEREALNSGVNIDHYALLPSEPERWRRYLQQQVKLGQNADSAWREYARLTHGERSGARLRRALSTVSETIAHAAARVAEGHTSNIQDVRSFPTAYHGANLVAVATYVRLVDLLDITDERTPYALWKFVSPKDPISRTEWRKHRAIGSVEVADGFVRISGVVTDPDIFVQVEDLKSWISSQFAESIGLLRQLSPKYQLPVDSQLLWQVEPSGFVPTLVRFEFDRQAALDLLTRELYNQDPHSFVRELMQNSVDAIDARRDLLAQTSGATIAGAIDVSIEGNDQSMRITWSDNGIGMDLETLRSYFAVLGRTWYDSLEFRELQHSCLPIARFGIGILSAFAVADSLHITTRREGTPQGDGLRVVIPRSGQHFRIHASGDIPIGTSITLALNPSILDTVSIESVRSAIRGTHGFVEHEVIVRLNGSAYVVPPIGQGNGGTAGLPTIDRTPDLVVDSHFHGAREAISKGLIVQTEHINGGNGVAEAYYSAAFPREGSAFRFELGVGYHVSAGVPPLDNHSVTSDGGELTFVKGILAATNDRVYSGAWPSPKLAVDIRNPSLIRPALDRRSATVVDPEVMAHVWAKIALRLKEALLRESSPEPEDKARAVGLAGFCGSAPFDAVSTWFAHEEWPVLALSEDGISWTELGRARANEDTVYEAPWELPHQSKKLWTNPLPAGVWHGPQAVLTASHEPYTRMPHYDLTVNMTKRLLRSAGFQLSGILPVSSPASDEVPLFCGVWKRGRLVAYQDIWQEVEAWLEDESMSSPSILSFIGGGDLPFVVSFPDELNQYMAIGSLYWNQRHEKTRSAVDALFRLAKLRRQNRLTPDAIKEYDIYRDVTRFAGYVVCSRKASPQMGIRRFQAWLSLSKAVGASGTEVLLGPDDFLPGTIDGYENPYGYNYLRWRESPTRVGEPLNSSNST
jgi:hypothetical protein